MSDPLRDKLEELARLHRRDIRRRRVTRAMMFWLIALTAALLLDTAWSLIGAAFENDPLVLHELPLAVRAAMSVALLIGWVCVALSAGLPAWLRRLDIHHYARFCEQRAEMAGNRLVNAVQLGARQWRDDLPATLSQRAVESARASIANIEPQALIDPTPLRRAKKRLAWMAATLIVLFGVGMLVLAPIMPWRAVMRLADPLGDHPPIGRYHWQVDRSPEPVAIGDTLTISARTVRPAEQPPHLVLLDDMGQRRARLAMALESPPNLFYLSIPNVRRPIRGMIVGSHARSRVFTIEPVHLPRLIDMELTLRLPDSDDPIALPATRGKPIVGPVGATVEIRARANREDATIDHPAAEGLHLESKLTAGSQKIAFRLVSPDGLTSRESHTLELVGLKPAELAEYIEQQRSEAEQASIAADLDGGDPAEATATGDDPNESETATDQSTGAKTGFNEQTTGTGGDQPAEAAPPDPLAGGNVVRSALADPALPVRYRALAGRAPPAYRERVAEYFLRLSRDTQKEPTP